MDVKNVFEKNHVQYKILDEEQPYAIYKIRNQGLLLCITCKGNRFKLHRDFYDYVADNSLPYMIICIDTKNTKEYLINPLKGVNWVKNCFDSCEKEEIYLGKQVMNYLVSENEMICEINKFFR